MDQFYQEQITSYEKIIKDVTGAIDENKVNLKSLELRELPEKHVHIRTIFKEVSGENYNTFISETPKPFESILYKQAMSQLEEKKKKNIEWKKTNPEYRRLDKLKRKLQTDLKSAKKKLSELKCKIPEPAAASAPVPVQEVPKKRVRLIIEDRAAKIGEETCLICFRNIPCMTSDSCNHTVMCFGCVDALYETGEKWGNKCPLCREELGTFTVSNNNI
jgi:hypothetical protein